MNYNLSKVCIYTKINCVVVGEKIRIALFFNFLLHCVRLDLVAPFLLWFLFDEKKKKKKPKIYESSGHDRPSTPLPLETQLLLQDFFSFCLLLSSSIYVQYTVYKYIRSGKVTSDFRELNIHLWVVQHI